LNRTTSPLAARAHSKSAENVTSFLVDVDVAGSGSAAQLGFEDLDLRHGAPSLVAHRGRCARGVRAYSISMFIDM